ncbi:MAG TPA: hypothetical protein DEF36_04925 [Desulfotomaculum sp.]|nr:hypothetical protein [Desulfotomaculum sp.]
MKLNELRQRLIREHVLKNAYSLDGGLPNEKYCLGYIGGLWETYYSEMGQKTSLKVFETEDEACNFFYNWLTKSLRSMGLLT